MVKNKDQSDNDFILKIAEVIYEINEIKKNEVKILNIDSIDKSMSCSKEISEKNKIID
ncbi:hypothetical protein LBMAG18_12710 [Alphaproteobacteria bacterium]|nr:hypothetical protein LBMAG18_12710 [Alphaproteobacteria bacterium]